MARRGEITKKARLRELLSERDVALVDPPLMAELRVALSPISDSYFEDLLRDAGVPLHPLVEGVSLHSPDELRRTLLTLSELYESSFAPRAVRERAIAAKVRLRALIARTSSEDLRREREEMHLELMTWLENPGVFPLWLRLRLQASETMKAHDSRH